MSSVVGEGGVSGTRLQGLTPLSVERDATPSSLALVGARSGHGYAFARVLIRPAIL
jgi:hypothetical protein